LFLLSRAATCTCTCSVFAFDELSDDDDDDEHVVSASSVEFFPASSQYFPFPAIRLLLAAVVDLALVIDYFLLLLTESDMDSIHPWIGLDWVSGGDHDPVLLVIIAAKLMLFLSNYDL